METKQYHYDQAMAALKEDATISDRIIQEKITNPDALQNLTSERLMAHRAHHMQRALVHATLALTAPE